MQLADHYVVIVTDRLRDCRDFYCRWLGFEVVFEATWFVLVTNTTGGHAASLAFMHPEHPSSPPAPAAYNGSGMFVTLQVADASAEYERLSAAGLQFDLPLTDEPWGQRRFAVIDPAGVWVDIVEQTQPAEGWWEPYLA